MSLEPLGPSEPPCPREGQEGREACEGEAADADAGFRFVCLVHYHEVGLKGRNRPSFERKLKQNVEGRLASLADVRVSRVSGRLLVSARSWPDALKAADMLVQVPGIVRLSCGIRAAQRLEDVCRASLWVLAQAEPFGTFKVDARRANTDFPLDSMQLNQRIGAWLCERLPEKGVRMRGPDAHLHVEMVEGSAFVYVHTRKAVGGLPVGTAGSVVCLLSAGFDSPVAAWRMMRRGASVTALHFSGRPETADASEHLVRDILEVLRPLGGVERLCVVAFGGYQREIAERVPPALRVILYRRLMLAVANRIAERWRAKALVTGESLGQVASQTLDNIRATGAVAAYPVLRPLIGMDKQEIIDEARLLGTYGISSVAHEDCCTLFMPRNPETHARPSQVDAVWAGLPIDAWLDRILADVEVLPFDR
ncbi:MAG: tRNA 4-thiouridine(8) synthase ThiI [Coriobacteriales bacterium]|jgi:thiamine biosynthesis protein ThiI|nr:tRNA 4-thiouridine(8) synthase ThiI [Coriobacteriales bacterium]